MGQEHGQILTANTVVFGIITVCVVAVRIGFRVKTRKASASDWFLAVALVSRIQS